MQYRFAKINGAKINLQVNSQTFMAAKLKGITVSRVLMCHCSVLEIGSLISETSEDYTHITLTLS